MMDMLHPPKFETWLGNVDFKESTSFVELLSIKPAGSDFVRFVIFRPTDPVVRGRIIRIGLQNSWFGSISCERHSDFCEIRIDGEEITQVVMNLLSLPYDAEEEA